jgi:hypothetical protein
MGEPLHCGRPVTRADRARVRLSTDSTMEGYLASNSRLGSPRHCYERHLLRDRRGCSHPRGRRRLVPLARLPRSSPPSKISAGAPGCPASLMLSRACGRHQMATLGSRSPSKKTKQAQLQAVSRSGRRGSTPRRSAWESEANLSIWFGLLSSVSLSWHGF